MVWKQPAILLNHQRCIVIRCVRLSTRQAVIIMTDHQSSSSPALRTRCDLRPPHLLSAILLPASPTSRKRRSPCPLDDMILVQWFPRPNLGGTFKNSRSTGSRFQLNVTAGSQKRAIANLRKSKGRDESRFALKLKRNLDFNCKSRSLSIFCHYLDKHCHYLDNQFVWAFSRCVENDSACGRHHGGIR